MHCLHVYSVYILTNRSVPQKLRVYRLSTTPHILGAFLMVLDPTVIDKR